MVIKNDGVGRKRKRKQKPWVERSKKKKMSDIKENLNSEEWKDAIVWKENWKWEIVRTGKTKTVVLMLVDR